MAADVNIVESNGAGEDTTDITSGNLNMGSGDYANITSAATLPIAANANGYEKYLRFYVNDISTSDHIKTLKVWMSTDSLTGTDAMMIYATESDYASKAYAQPVATDSTVATYFIEESEPTGANVGYNSSLTATLGNATYSDYIPIQLQVAADTTSGGSYTLSFKYDEVA